MYFTLAQRLRTRAGCERVRSLCFDARNRRLEMDEFLSILPFDPELRFSFIVKQVHLSPSGRSQGVEESNGKLRRGPLSNLLDFLAGFVVSVFEHIRRGEESISLSGSSTLFLGAPLRARFRPPRKHEPCHQATQSQSRKTNEKTRKLGSSPTKTRAHRVFPLLAHHPSLHEPFPAPRHEYQAYKDSRNSSPQSLFVSRSIQRIKKSTRPATTLLSFKPQEGAYLGVSST